MTVLIDSSAWVEYIRATGSRVNGQVKDVVRASESATTDPIMLEVVGGGRSEHEALQLLRLLYTSHYVAQQPRADAIAGAALYRRCRAAGETVRSLNGCLIAAIAIRSGLAVLHLDRDFEVLARHTELEVVSG